MNLVFLFSHFVFSSSSVYGQVPLVTDADQMEVLVDALIEADRVERGEGGGGRGERRGGGREESERGGIGRSGGAVKRGGSGEGGEEEAGGGVREGKVYPSQQKVLEAGDRAMEAMD
jgi:hypothetical protein